MSKNVLTTSIGDFSISKRLGKGAFGEVLLVKDPETKKDIALKLLTPNLFDTKRIERFKHEFKILSELNHKNIARVFHFGFTTSKLKQYFFTTEYIAGQDCCTACQHQNQSFVEDVIMQILTALDYIHAQGVIHFDIKAENILIILENGKPQVKLLDFGIASRLKQKDKELAGTLPTMAPEVICKSPHVNQQLDMYSLGMLLLNSFTSKWPFDIKSKKDIINWHLNGHLSQDLISKIPSAFREFVVKLLQKNPSDRFSSAYVAMNFLNATLGNKFMSYQKNLTHRIPDEGPFVGSDKLRKTIKTSIANKPEGFFLFTGSLGIGKTRLLKEVRHQLELTENPIIELSGERAQTLWPVLAKSLNITAATKNQTTHVNRADALITFAKKQPLNLIIDDLHLADDDFKDFLIVLKNRLELSNQNKNKPTLALIMASGDEEREDFLKSFEKHVVPLETLTKENIQEYLTLTLGQENTTKQLASLLHDFSSGLPLLMVEGLKSLAPHIGQDIDLKKHLPPQDVSNIYATQLKTCTGFEKDLLHTISLIFRPTTQHELISIINNKPSTIVDSIQDLIRKKLVKKLADNTFQTTNHALALSLNNVLNKKDKETFHLKIALGLEKLKKPSHEDLAFHFLRSGDAKKAERYYLKASQTYETKGQRLLAAKYLVPLLSLYPENTDPFHETVVRIAQHFIYAGDYQKAQKTLQKTQHTNSFRYLQAEGLLYYKTRDYTNAVEAYEKLLELSREDNLDKVLNINALANVYLQTGKTDKAEQLFTKAQKLKAKLTNNIITPTNDNLGLVYSLNKNHEKAIAFYDKQHKDYLANYPSEAIDALGKKGYALLMADRLDDAIDTLNTALREAEIKQLYHLIFSLLGNLSTALQKKNLQTHTLRLLKKMTMYQERFGSARDLAYNLMRQGSVSSQLGLFEAALKYLTRGKSFAQHASDPNLSLWLDFFTANVHYELGESQKAETLLNKTCTKALECENHDVAAWGFVLLAELYLEWGEFENAASQLHKITQAPQDIEFLITHDVVKAQLKPLIKKPLEGKSLDELENLCVEKNVNDLLWKVYAAKEDFSKAHKTIRTIADFLPEEYRHHYLNQRHIKHIIKQSGEENPMLHNTELSKLLDINKIILSEHNPDRVLELIMDKAIELSNAEEGFLLLLNDENIFEPRVARNVNKENVEAVSFSQNIAKQVALSGDALFSANALEDDELSVHESIISLELRSVVCVPLKSHGKTIGVVYLATSQQRSQITRDFVPILQNFADHAIIALQNAKKFDEKDKTNQTLQNNLEEAEKSLEAKDSIILDLEDKLTQKKRNTKFAYDKIIGRSKKMEDVLKLMDKVTNAKVSVFIHGETGTGKELIARALHQNSIRKSKDFVAINCSAFTETILESELFGYMKGSFTGADRDRKGLFEQASGGTLFLDEIGEMSPSMQAKVLRVIQEQEIMRVGGRQPIKIDVRIVSASNRDLKKMVRDKTFREDLYYRLAGITIELPSLKDRKEDIVLLMSHFIEKIRKENNIKDKITFTKTAHKKLLDYHWPGNVRELEQALTSASLLSEKGKIGPDEILLQQELYGQEPIKEHVPCGACIKYDPQKTIEDYEAELISLALKHHDGNKSKAAKSLGWSRLTLYKKIEEYKIHSN
jgi:transcriptional regulator with GAF, ATPase, and Fis domain/serine/threonine protein kinase